MALARSLRAKGEVAKAMEIEEVTLTRFSPPEVLEFFRALKEWNYPTPQ
jgi:hypothetical protein